MVGQAADGIEAGEIARHTRPDVVLMGIRMPRLTGSRPPSAARPTRLIVTTYELDEYVVEALRAGAAGFILKDAPPEELVNAGRVINMRSRARVMEPVTPLRVPLGVSISVKISDAGARRCRQLVLVVPARGRERYKSEANELFQNIQADRARV